MPKVDVVRATTDVRVLSRDCRDDRISLGRGRVDAGCQGRADLVTDHRGRVAAHAPAVALGALRRILLGHAPHAGAEIRILGQFGQLHPRLDLPRSE
ncbi:hypothetical protein [Micromonospora sp. IBHARD004]|uniref:hypothetical protein n=1 Tax=Micromonospora sp. IBHARD004 TaxID=3457764 RepID=UPI004058E767